MEKKNKCDICGGKGIIYGYKREEECWQCSGTDKARNIKIIYLFGIMTIIIVFISLIVGIIFLVATNAGATGGCDYKALYVRVVYAYPIPNPNNISAYAFSATLFNQGTESCQASVMRLDIHNETWARKILVNTPPTPPSSYRIVTMPFESLYNGSEWASVHNHTYLVRAYADYNQIIQELSERNNEVEGKVFVK